MALARPSLKPRFLPAPRAEARRAEWFQAQARPRTREGPRAKPPREGTRRERAGQVRAGAPDHRAPVPSKALKTSQMGRRNAWEGGTPSRAGQAQRKTRTPRTTVRPWAWGRP